MRAIQIHATGGPEVLRLGDAPKPSPGPGQVLIKVAAVGVNFYETLQRRGSYRQPPSMPFIPGGEVAGAHRRMEQRDSTGKLVLIVDEAAAQS